MSNSFKEIEAFLNKRIVFLSISIDQNYLERGDKNQIKNVIFEELTRKFSSAILKSIFDFICIEHDFANYAEKIMLSGILLSLSDKDFILKSLALKIAKIQDLKREINRINKPKLVKYWV